MAKDNVDAVGELMVGVLRELETPAELRVACGKFRRLLDSVCPEPQPVDVPVPITPMDDREAQLYGQRDAFFDTSVSFMDVPRERLERWAEQRRKHARELAAYLLSQYRLRQDGLS